MKKLNTEKDDALVSVRDLVQGRQANNLLASNLGVSVRPWFADWTESGVYSKISQALLELDQPARRERAAAYLGLQIIAA